MNRKTNQVKVGGVLLGGGAPVRIQSMLNAPPHKIEENISQAIELERAGCEILRVAIPTLESVELVPRLKEAVAIPIVADIHFDYRLALECVAAGVDKIRINPGNIGDAGRVKMVADACRAKGIPIRIGVNSGSVEKSILAKYGHPTPQAMVESALYHASLLEQHDFHDILISMKSGHVKDMLAAYRLAAEQCDYPLHLGVTHAGTSRVGLLKSAMGIGGLLLEGIGDTIRVSLTADPVEEIYAAKDILAAAELKQAGPTVISCPTCGRTKVDLISMTRQVEEALKNCTQPITVAVMGCVVNGPGEAREADVGICCGDGSGALFAKGKVLGKYAEGELVPALLEQVALLDKGDEKK